MVSYKRVLKNVVPGNAEASELYRRVESGSMPKRGQPLDKEEVGAIRRWIDEGAMNN